MLNNLHLQYNYKSGADPERGRHVLFEPPFYLVELTISGRLAGAFSSLHSSSRSHKKYAAWSGGGTTSKIHGSGGGATCNLNLDPINAKVPKARRFQAKFSESSGSTESSQWDVTESSEVTDRILKPVSQPKLASRARKLACAVCCLL